ncbi:MAG: hypothetical protein AB1758_30290, partial [Candidatus Eremiobacterota bacterium]
ARGVAQGAGEGLGGVLDAYGGALAYGGRLANHDAETWAQTGTAAQVTLEGLAYGHGQLVGSWGGLLQGAGRTTGLKPVEDAGRLLSQVGSAEQSLARPEVRKAVDALEGALANLAGRGLEAAGTGLGPPGSWLAGQGRNLQEGSAGNPLVEAAEKALQERLEEYRTDGEFAIARDATQVALEVAGLFVGPEMLLGRLGARAPRAAGEAARGVTTTLDESAQLGKQLAHSADDLPDTLPGGRYPPGDVGNPSAEDIARAVYDERRWLGDPYHPVARHQVWHPGYTYDPGYLQTLEGVVQDLATQPPRNLFAAMNRIVGGPLGPARISLQDVKPDHLFLPRGARGMPSDTPLIMDGRPTRYATAGPEGGPSVLDRAQQQMGDSWDPWYHTTTDTLDGQPVNLTTVYRRPDGDVWWHHTDLDPDTHQRIVTRANELYHRALDPSLPMEETLRTVGELSWWSSQATLFARGSATVTEALTRSILDARGIATSAYRRGISPDLEAFVTPREVFADNFARLFQAPPRWKPAG